MLRLDVLVPATCNVRQQYTKQLATKIPCGLEGELLFAVIAGKKLFLLPHVRIVEVLPQTWKGQMCVFSAASLIWV
jgi:hypothetical protein